MHTLNNLRKSSHGLRLRNSVVMASGNCQIVGRSVLWVGENAIDNKLG